MASVASRISNLNHIADRRELQALLADIQSDLAALRTAIVGITAKLDADAGVTDTNYGALWNPAAQKTTA